MESTLFKIPEEDFAILSQTYPNLGKNSHVGHFAVEAVKCYFLSLFPGAVFVTNKKGIDLEVNLNGKTTSYEIKGTASSDLAWGKLKVSGLASYNAIINGMEIIRVSNVGSQIVVLHFLKNDLHFTVHPEARWTIKRKKI